MAKKAKNEDGYLKYQQGDVLLFTFAKLPEGKLTPVIPGSRGFVLAEGEATGHAHVVEPPPAKDDVQFYTDAQGTLWMSTKKDAVLKHEEHGHIKVQPGTYKVGRVQEIDPMSREIDAVRD